MQQMAEKKAIGDVLQPPAYVLTTMPSCKETNRKSSVKSKALFGYAVAITTALIVVLILGGVYYYRSLDVIQDAIKKYQTVTNYGGASITQDMEIDASNNIVTKLSGNGLAPGSFSVLDYTKSLYGYYNASEKKCYIAGGIQNIISDPQTFVYMIEHNITRSGDMKRISYQLADAYPISDKSILPAAMRSACSYLPVYWLEHVIEPNSAPTKSVYKRDAGSAGASGSAAAAVAGGYDLCCSCCIEYPILQFIACYCCFRCYRIGSGSA